MKALLPFIVSYVSGELSRTIRTLKRKAILIALAGFFALVTVAFLLAAAEMALSLLFPPLFAALIIAGCAFVICLLFFIILQIVSASSRRRARHRRAEVPAYAAAAATAVPSVFKSKKTMLFAGIPIAALAGYLLFGRRRSRDDEDY
jgi:NADH:ubiquinone oxidoreductase subunit 2 (subunit N)